MEDKKITSETGHADMALSTWAAICIILLVIGANNGSGVMVGSVASERPWEFGTVLVYPLSHHQS